ncbi:TBC1 domain family member whacked-like [Lineus longissimus]|uniref:TBC1 domain family member whacked-like n=1 Tax=Lineus longissimus TaxID=88925 RepID=UPI002B4F4B0F
MEGNIEAFDHHGFQLSPPSSSRFPTPPSSSTCSPPSPLADSVALMTVASPSCVCSSPKLNGRTRRKPRVVNRKKDLTSSTEKVWGVLLDGWKGNNTNSKQNGKLESLLSKGVPTSVRPTLWKTLLESETLATASKFDYKSNVVALREQLVDCGLSEYGGKKILMALNQMSFEKDTELLNKGMIPIRYIRQIMADLDRTYPTHRMFMGDRPEAKEGRASLFRVLAVYVRYNKQVGYCQGMSYIAGMLLMLMGEEDTFWCIVSLLERHKYLLGYFDTKLTRIHMHGHIFSRLLRKRHPRLAKHFHNLEIEVLMFITPWFMSLFTCLSCWDMVLAIWDMLIIKGFTSIFQVSLAIISLCEEELLEKTEMSTLLPILLHLPHNIVAHKTLLPVIQATVVEKWEIDGLQAVIEEEISLARTMKKRRRPERENAVPQEQDCRAKRQKTANDSSNQGLFGKLVNMFSWTGTEEPPKRATRHRPIVQSKSRVPGKVRKATALGYPFQGHISPCQEAREKRNKFGEHAIPPRRSPRLALITLSNPNAGQATDRLVGESAKTRFVFKGFATPTPLRQSQKMYASPAFVSSPEVELKPMTRK